MHVASTPAVIAFVIAASSGARLIAQVPSARILNAPFTATSTIVRNADGKIGIQTFYLARASNGSSYSAESGTNGRVFRITIVDVPNARTITLTPNPSSHTYTEVPIPHGTLRTLTTQQVLDGLAEMNQNYIDQPDRDHSGIAYHITSLGQTQEEGMILFGDRQELTFKNGDRRTIETWHSNLGIEMSARVDDPSKKITSVKSVTNLVRKEPDPKLFEIPAEYLPHPDPHSMPRPSSSPAM